MRLDSEPPPTVTIVPTHVKVTNGAGEVLIDQDLTAPYKAAADPPSEKLDGTLTIETRWDNGTTSTQVLEHPPGTRVSLKQDGKNYMLAEPAKEPIKKDEEPEEGAGADHD
ncbi:MAG: hypothetical protein ACREEP_10235 [Dongiaceae bacterium]